MLLDTSGLVCCFDADDTRHLAAVAGNCPVRHGLPAGAGRIFDQPPILGHQFPNR